jgi:hypothetical protein
MKTYLGYVLRRLPDGSHTFTPPDDYLDPEPPDPAVGPTVATNPWTGEWFAAAGAGDADPGRLVAAGVSGPAP